MSGTIAPRRPSSWDLARHLCYRPQPVLISRLSLGIAIDFGTMAVFASIYPVEVAKCSMIMAILENDGRTVACLTGADKESINLCCFRGIQSLRAAFKRLKHDIRLFSVKTPC